ncbi:carbohydrate-binding domain-containing protein [Gaoshiqia sp. Z1-71]|uniref:carbohydrate-binding domain-containing protein n=1 Tax=Gaoshiqia hydrogeniformans TaxID=3290090 RepID=UPI003BF920CF
MNTRFFLRITSSLLLSVFIISCLHINDDNEDEEESKPDETTVDTTTGNAEPHEDPADYVWDSSSENIITLHGSSITVSGSGASANGSVLTITAAGNYNISGSLTNGQIIVNTEETEIVRLIFNGIDVSCSNSAPVNIKKAGKVIIILPENTNNYLADGTSYTFDSSSDDEPNAALFSKSALSIYGNGSLTVNGNYNDGITGKDGLIITAGTISVTANDDGIRGKDYLIIKSGTFNLTTGGDGLKSDNETNAAKGYISVESATVTITSGTDAMQAVTDILIASGTFNLKSGGGSSSSISSLISAKGLKAEISIIIDYGDFIINSADDGLHSGGSLVINNGNITISSRDDGIHADGAIVINGGNIEITKSYEGIEGPSITVNSGNLSIASSDDGFNATSGRGGESNDGSYLNLYGGNIVVNASGGDGIDSNGNMRMTAGTVLVHGPSGSVEVGMDVNGNIDVTGGTLIISGTGSNMTEAPNTSTSQYSVLIFFTSSRAAGTLFHLQDTNGNEIVTFQPIRSYSSMVVSSPALTKGTSYQIYTGGTHTGTVEDGLYSGGTYSGGILYGSFTISATLTKVGSSSGGTGGR